MRSYRDESFKIIKGKVFSILVDPSTYVMAPGPSTETPFDEDMIDRICGIAIGFGALDEERTEDQQGMIITGAVLLEQGQTYIGLQHTPPQESVNDADEVDENQTLEGAIATLHMELRAEMEAKHDGEMHFSWALDFNRRADGMRPCRATGEPQITIIGRKQFNATERGTIITLLQRWGYTDMYKTRKAKIKIAEAACRVVAYDSGFEKAPLGSMVAQYIADWERGIKGFYGKLVSNAVEKKKMGTKQGTYIDTCFGFWWPASITPCSSLLAHHSLYFLFNLYSMYHTLCQW